MPKRSVVMASVLVCLGACAWPVATGWAIPTAGTVTEFKKGVTPGSNPYGITAGPDGNVWFTEYYADRVARITPAGKVTGFSITPGSYPQEITTGPDGNLWFDEYVGNRIGRVTPSGTVTEFSAGITPRAGFDGITAGPDGNVWFSEGDANRIGRITTSGTVTEFSAGITPGSYPFGIAAGPDGNLWFPELNGDRIGRITPSGTVTEFSAGITPGSYPQNITAGPDGNLWFAEYADRIGRITPSGTVTEFSTGITPGSHPYAIASAPDGNLWFTEVRDQIGRITPSGTVTEFSTGITPGSFPYGIAAGADGNLWFTELNGNRIGRITAEAPSPAAPTFAASSRGAVSKSLTTLLTGSAKPGSTVRVYATADCSGAPVATGPAATFATTGLQVTVAVNATATFHATAGDATGTSECSTSTITFTNDRVAPAAPVFTKTVVNATTLTARLSGTAEAGGRVAVYATGTCSGPAAITGTVAAFASPGLKVSTPVGTTTFTATVTDAAGNVSACSASTQVTQ